MNVTAASLTPHSFSADRQLQVWPTTVQMQCYTGSTRLILPSPSGNHSDFELEIPSAHLHTPVWLALASRWLLVDKIPSNKRIPSPSRMRCKESALGR